MRRARRLEPQQRPILLVRQQIEKPVGPLPHLADPLLELGQHRVAAYGEAIRGQDDPLQLLTDERPDEDAALPFGKAIARVERHAGEADRGSPEEPGLLEIVTGRLARNRAAAAADLPRVRP